MLWLILILISSESDIFYASENLWWQKLHVFADWKQGKRRLYSAEEDRNAIVFIKIYF